MSESLGRDRLEQRAGPFSFTETWHAPALVLPTHEHEHACLHFVIDGRYQETVAGRAQSLGPGAVLYKPAGVAHSNRFAGCGARTLRIELWPELESSLGERSHGPIHAEHPALECVARRVHDELIAADAWTPLALEGLARELLALLFREPAHPDPRARLAEACAARLRERFRGPLALGELARELGCERTALARAFRRRYRASMGEYVRLLRVTEVMRRMERDDAPLSEIALDAGFSDQSHCTRVFHRHVGLTPAAWARTRVPAVRERSRRRAPPA